MLFGWSPGIGDPTPVGWLTVVTYLVAAGLCVRAGRIGVLKTGRFGFWEAMAITLLALGINKQLDLQELVTGIGRYFAKDEGWYSDRRRVQYISIAALAGCAAVFTTTLIFLMRKSDTFKRSAIIGLTVLVVFILIRAAPFHHVDEKLGLNFGGVTLNNFLELGGIAAIAVSAAFSPTDRKYIARQKLLQ